MLTKLRRWRLGTWRIAVDFKTRARDFDRTPHAGHPVEASNQPTVCNLWMGKRLLNTEHPARWYPGGIQGAEGRIQQLSAVNVQRMRTLSSLW